MGIKRQLGLSMDLLLSVFSFDPRPSVVRGGRVDKLADFTFKFAAIVPILLRQEICFLLPYSTSYFSYFFYYIFQGLYFLNKYFASSLDCWPKPDISGSRQTISNLFHNTRET